MDHFSAHTAAAGEKEKGALFRTRIFLVLFSAALCSSAVFHQFVCCVFARDESVCTDDNKGKHVRQMANKNTSVGVQPLIGVSSAD